MTPAYQQGIIHALNALGFKTASEAEEKGTPFPSKSPNIGAERLAQILQQQNDTPTSVYPENRRYRQFGKPVSWDHPVDLSGLDQGQPVAGILAPTSPRS